MKLYKAKIELHSPICTVLKGDTIWGHVVWGIANHEGDASVKEFLEECKGNDPLFVISSAFPSGTLPRPETEENMPFSILTKAEYASIKEEKKQKLIPSFLEPERQSSSLDKHFIRQMQMHNTINRTDLTVLDEGLFATDTAWSDTETFAGSKPVFDLYIASSLEERRILQLLEWAFEQGYGADASTGKGVITVFRDIISVDAGLFEGRRCMALGPFINANKAMPSNLLAETFIRRGKIGGAYSDYINPFKKTLIMFDEGATFIHSRDKPYIGTLIENIHTDERICHSGFTPVVPCGGAI